MFVVKDVSMKVERPNFTENLHLFNRFRRKSFSRINLTDRNCAFYMHALHVLIHAQIMLTRTQKNILNIGKKNYFYSLLEPKKITAWLLFRNKGSDPKGLGPKES